jgi:hypothetical protein
MNQNINYLQVRLLTFLFILLPGIALSSCIDPVVKQERNVGQFTGIKVGGAFEVVLSQTGKHRLVVEAEEDLLDKVRTEVKGDVLHIDMEWDWSWKGNDDIIIYIDFKDLESLEISGAADVRADTPINANDLDIRVSGAGDMELEVDANTIDVTVSGAGDLRVSGSTDRQKVRLSGAGDYEAQHLKSNYTYAKASGAGTIVVYASEEIEAYASGAGSVKYYGDPDKEKSNASGAGSIRKR